MLWQHYHGNGDGNMSWRWNPSEIQEKENQTKRVDDAMRCDARECTRQKADVRG